MGKYANSVSYMGRKATADHSGQAEFATAAEALAATADDLIVSPSTMQSSIAAGLRLDAGAVTDMSGTGTLVAGTDTILNTNVATGDYIFITRIGAAASTTLGELSYTISDGASFTVNSLILGTPGSVQTGGLSTYAYTIVRPV